ncbi:hypothetical protein LGL05_12600 [Clostridium tagluense]|nr:hypothetical protein [Clostridium tagluense]
MHGRFDVLCKIVKFVKEREDIDCVILCGDITADCVGTSFNEIEDIQYDDYKKAIQMLQQINKKDAKN